MALPDNNDTEDYLSELYQRAARSGIIISSISSPDKAGSASVSYVCGAVNGAAGSQTPVVAASAGTQSSTGENQGASLSGSSAACVEAQFMEVTVQGSWDQIVNFFKYVADSNRIANLKGVSINTAASSGTPGQGASSDLLSAKVDLEIYFKSKNGNGDLTTIAALASGSGFDKNALQNLKNMVYVPYEAPAVAEMGERNIFK